MTSAEYLDIMRAIDDLQSRYHGDGIRLKSVIDLIDGDGHVFGPRLCQTCNAVSSLIGSPFGCAKKRL